MIDLSIIIPTLNRDRCLKSCLDSLICQSYYADKFEILVVDNGSTDNTKKVTEEIILLSNKYHIRYI